MQYYSDRASTVEVSATPHDARSRAHPNAPDSQKQLQVRRGAKAESRCSVARFRGPSLYTHTHTSCYPLRIRNISQQHSELAQGTGSWSDSLTILALFIREITHPGRMHEMSKYIGTREEVTVETTVYEGPRHVQTLL